MTKVDFALEGVFLGFADSPRFLRLETAEGQREIKLSKEVCAYLYRHVYALGKTLNRGDRLRVSGVRKKECSWKAYALELLDGLGEVDSAAPQVAAQLCLGVCHGKKCAAAGAGALKDLLAAAVDADPSLVGRVRVRALDCQKQCKQAPVVVVGGRSISRVAIADLPSVVAAVGQWVQRSHA